jgi:hypothetical protein
MDVGRQEKGVPLFQKVPDCTLCPSKSRNKVAVAVGKLFSTGADLAMFNVKNVSKTTKSDLVFIRLVFRI